LYLLTQLLVHLQLFEVILFFLSNRDLLLHLELLSEIHFLQFAELTYSHKLLFMAGQGFTHCELILVFSTIDFLFIAFFWCLSYSELFSARRQMRRAIFKEKI